MSVHSQVLIVGGGPVGFFLALKLGQAGVNVTVVEAAKEVDKSPRACVYYPFVLKECEKVGIIDDLREAGLSHIFSLQWRNINFEPLATIPSGPTSGLPEVIFLGQHDFAAVVLKHIAKYSNIKVHFNHKLVGIQQSDDEVTALLTTPDGETFVTADFVIGCDGTGSSVRRCLCIPYEGFTWPDFRFVATNVHYDFEKKHGINDVSFIVDPEDWAIIVRTGNDAAPWRVCYGERQRVKEKYKKLLPGAAPEDYKVELVSPYYAHQRCAKQYVKGRVILCGDAAHSNNPIGALGLTTGTMDAVTLGNILHRIIKLGESPDLLREYETVRRKVFLEVTNPMSMNNKAILCSTEPEDVEARAHFFHMVNSNSDFHHLMNRGLEPQFSNIFEVDETNAVDN